MTRTAKGQIEAGNVVPMLSPLGGGNGISSLLGNRKNETYASPTVVQDDHLSQ